MRDGTLVAPGDGMAGVLFRWFVLYNPFYFFSALCVLAGVALASRDVESHRVLFGVVQAYEALLIAAAAILLRRLSDARPAVILGLVELFFLFDGTFGAERLTVLESPGLNVAAGLAGAFKLWILARVFGLRRIRWSLRLAGAALVFLPIAPVLIEAREGLHLAFFWAGAGLFAWALAQNPRRWDSDFAEDEWSQTVLRRVGRAAPLIIAGLFVLHGISWSVCLSIPLSWALAAPYVLVAGMLGASRWRSEAPAWGSSAASLGLALSAGTTPAAIIAFVSGAWLLALAGRCRLRSALPGILFLFAGVHLLGRETMPSVTWCASLCGALLAAAYLRRSFSCVAASAGAMALAFASAAPLPYAPMAFGMWLAVWTWILVPDLRLWVPPAAAIALTCAGGYWIVSHSEPADFAYAYAMIVLALFGAAAALRDPGYAAMGAGGTAFWAIGKRGLWMPHSDLAWGAIALAAGFLFLICGFVLNLALSRRSKLVKSVRQF